MEDHEREPSSAVAYVSRKQRVAGTLTSIGDFFNTLKAFIGTNYLSLAFAFSNSGLIFGIVGVFLIASLTDHCCQLLVKCKYFVVDELVDKETRDRPLSASELLSLRRKLERTISYGELGRLSFGRWAEVFINVLVLFTQFLGCVAYFIFIGNAIFTIFPMEPAWSSLNASTPYHNLSLSQSVDHGRFARLANGVPLLTIDNIPGGREQKSLPHPSHSRPKRAWDWEPFDLPTFTTQTEEPRNDSTTATSSPRARNTSSTTPLPVPLMHTIAPDLKYLVMIPLPIFLCTSLIRKLRILSPLTVIASTSLFIGAASVLVFLAVGFTIRPGFSWIKFESLPLFIGQLTSAYEGIGCVLPIESSMEGNRHLFPAFLHLSIYVVFFVLTAFGVLGYLRYGDNVQQIILLSIPQHSPLAISVDITLIISVLCTFPLQMFPVIQIMESYVFGQGFCCAPARQQPLSVQSEDQAPIIGDDGLIGSGEYGRSSDAAGSHSCHEVIMDIPEKVSRWKRNLLRVAITTLCMGFAIALRNSYAYLAAFSGAVGCSLLAFIIPCAIHIQLRRREMGVLLFIKDLIIIFLSIVASILVLVIIIAKIAKHEVDI